MGSGGSRDVPLLGRHATSRIGYTGPRRGNSVAGPSEVSLQRMRRGQWTRVAVAWDAAAVRMYVDGVLYARTTQGPWRWRGADGLVSCLPGAGPLALRLLSGGAVGRVRVRPARRVAPASRLVRRQLCPPPTGLIHGGGLFAYRLAIAILRSRILTIRGTEDFRMPLRLVLSSIADPRPQSLIILRMSRVEGSRLVKGLAAERLFPCCGVSVEVQAAALRAPAVGQGGPAHR